MSLDRWDPFRDATSFRDAMDRLFQETFFRPARDLIPGNRTAIPVDVREEGNTYVVHATIPGVNPNDISITVQGNVLTLRGQTQLEEERREQNYIMRERRSGTFYRAITLPEDVNADQAQARYENGVLTIALPKAEQQGPRRIQIGAQQGQQPGSQGQNPPAGSASPSGSAASQTGTGSTSGSSSSGGSSSVGINQQPTTDQVPQTERRPLDDIPRPTASASQQGTGTSTGGVDEVTTSSMESFPASDPPAWSR